MTDRIELHLSEEDYAREPLAAKLAEFLIETGTVTLVDSQGRAVDFDGNFTEGEWDDVREKYIPHPTVKPSDVKLSTVEPSTVEPSTVEPSTVEPSVDSTSTVESPKRRAGTTK